jgi:ketosteroid isomerase-like protein
VSDPAAVVRRYFEVVSDLGSTEEDLLALLHPDVRITEHPNAISPAGATRDHAAVVTAFRAGKQLLSAQTFDVHEVLADGDRVAVRATWRGTVGLDTPRFPIGTELVAQMCGMLTVSGGLIREHETFDCYEPF